MSSRIRAARPATFISAAPAVVAAIVLLMPAVASAAGATTFYARVNKKSGAMRIVSAKAKCKRAEHKLSWGSTGPAGPAGATGAAGAPGANGVGADYSSFSLTLLQLALSETAEIVVSKTIPAGTYFTSAKTVAAGGEASSPVFVAVICQLVDSASTPHFGEASEAIDTSEWAQPLADAGAGHYAGAATMELQGQLTTTEPTTLALVCIPIEGTKEATVDVFDSQVSALQTTANK